MGHTETQPALGTCNHEDRRYIGSTGEEDQVFPCTEPATVYDLTDDTEKCLAHFLATEK
jgi:hypothetical protein